MRVDFWSKMRPKRDGLWIHIVWKNGFECDGLFPSYDLLEIRSSITFYGRDEKGNFNYQNTVYLPFANVSRIEVLAVIGAVAKRQREKCRVLKQSSTL